MKKRFLPIGVISFLICGLAVLFLFSGNEQNNKQIIVPSGGGQSIAGAKEYLALIRNNQHTGILNPQDVIAAREQIEEKAMLKSGNGSQNLDWIEMGPNNIGGRTRALIFDNQDPTAKTLIAGSVTGGLFKSTNLGSSWSKINTTSGTANLNVSTMEQSLDGTIYVGTGEGMDTENYTALGEWGYEGGFVGRGIFKSVSDDNFTRLAGTNPANNTDFAYINKIKIDTKNNRLFAATQSSLQYASFPIENAESWSSACGHSYDSAVIYRTISRDSIIVCDSFDIIDGEYEIYGQTGDAQVILTQDDTTNVEPIYSGYMPFVEQGNVYDVDISDDGWIIAAFNGFIYVSESGDPNKFVKRSIYPENDDYIRQDDINFETDIIIKNQSGYVINQPTLNESSEVVDWHTDYVYIDVTFNPVTKYPSSENDGRVSFAIAPSNQNIVYAMAAKSSAPMKNGLFNIYLSEDKGNSWRIIAPGGSNLNNILGYYYFDDNATVYYYQGDYNNTLTVFPNDPYHVLAGGVNMWEGTRTQETGYYVWEEKSIGNPLFVNDGIYNFLYCHVDHHAYVFMPGSNNQFYAATDGGIYSVSYDGSFYYFAAQNINYNVTQFYSVDVSAYPYEAIGGTQDNGTQHIKGSGNTPMRGDDMWRPATLDSKYPEGTDGGFVGMSNIRVNISNGDDIPPATFYEKSPLPKNELLKDRLRRSETMGYDFSTNFFESYDSPSNNNFLTPILLWESYDNENSRDSILFVAAQNYIPGDTMIVRSSHTRYPIRYEFTEPLSSGDTLMIQDIISSKLFLGCIDEIWMSLNATSFDQPTDWHVISEKSINDGFANNPSSMATSTDGNYLFVGNLEGELYRISNIALAYDSVLADVNSSSCIINTTKLLVGENNTQAITSISVDPNNTNNVLVTLGNYGNTNYVYYSTNALDDEPDFVLKQGDLPLMPVYSSVLEMQEETNIAIIGTEEGIWMTDNIAVQSPQWYYASYNIGSIPVLELKQQTNSKTSFTVNQVDPGTGITISEVYPAITNFGMIYAATHGRGIFRNETYQTVGVDEKEANGGSANAGNLSVYPNPASDLISVNFNIQNNTPVQINIYDLSGKLVQQSIKTALGRGNQTIQLNTQTLTKGTYLVKMVAGNEINTAKLIIIK